ncbi:hypothetical protein HA466_0011340 [Hirschfeldia incana]|nr:hypothetical protein HA466_0011340 [Hirschfeldia incana]
MEKISTSNRQKRLVLLALLLRRAPSPLMGMCSLQSCDQNPGERGLSLKQRVWIGGKPIEGNVETKLERTMRRRMRIFGDQGK